MGIKDIPFSCGRTTANTTRARDGARCSCVSSKSYALNAREPASSFGSANPAGCHSHQPSKFGRDPAYLKRIPGPGLARSHSKPHRTKSASMPVRYGPSSDRAEWPASSLPGAHERAALKMREDELMDMSASIKSRARTYAVRKDDLAYRRARHGSTPNMIREKERLAQTKTELIQLRSEFERKASKLQKDYVSFADKLRGESRYSDRRVGKGCTEADRIETAIESLVQRVDDAFGILAKRR